MRPPTKVAPLRVAGSSATIVRIAGFAASTLRLTILCRGAPLSVTKY
jgi:hypothetical protein